MNGTSAMAIDPGVRLREDQVRLGLWMFLGTVTMLFAAFTSAYIVRRSGSDWLPISLPPILWANTLTLMASSLTLEGAYRSGARGRWAASGAAFAATIGLGVVFLSGQITAWRQLVAAGAYLPTNPHSSFFYMLTGAHAVHLAAALLVLGWGALGTWRGTGLSRPREWAASMGVCRTFWHYLGVVWVFLFALISLF